MNIETMEAAGMTTPKTLIINGSPRKNGDTAALVAELRRHLRGEITELSAYRDKISPCVDCRSCFKTRGCAIDDAMRVIYADDFRGVVLATPVYYADLPGPVRSLMSRFQWQRGAKTVGEPFYPRPKKAGLILAAGGSGNESGVNRPARILFKLMNASGFEEHTVVSPNTDTRPAADDESALAGVRALAAWLSE